jgi:polysaccharide export outer membrane protein
MFSRSRAVVALLLLIPLLLVTAGCYTRLTTPKEAINYLSPGGEPVGPFAIKAPDYNAFLRDQEEQGNLSESEYRLIPGTRVQIEVYGHGIEATVNIRPDGIIDLPLVGDVQAEGRTISQLKSEVSDRFKEFFVDPPQIILNTDVTENQDEVKAGDVSVINPTGRSGVVNLTGDEFLSQILADVRAFHPKAEWNEIAVIRRGRAIEERYVIVCDMEKLLRQADFDQDVKMRNGDIVFVPHEKNTILEEIVASFGVLSDFVSDADSITSYIERVEGY